MTLIVIVSMILGIGFGYFIFPQSIIENLDSIASICLYVIIFLVGIDVGSNKKIIKDIKAIGVKVLIIPIAVILGSLVGGLISGVIFKMPYNESLAVASGFGWYSLSGIMLTELANAQLGAMAFLSNVFREVIAVVSIPILAKKLNYYSAIAPAGATSMDTTLPLIAKATDPEVAVIAFINGVILSSLVPVLVTFFYNL
ncbi:MAG: lysine exporter LysO family protein [Clostridium argentinense]|uniref:Lysine exporter LysO family protein n=1 Tax=Clostridium faecium TaxID=2762223 RepID=A0ABR8YNJ9_9CLOT|nr:MULTISPECIES: lysine exporter LysO family protein [Clostridium]MBD8045717.1 lysine exporter LysO family protein [Clostridium faecium]MBS5823978.1 lysine exporter LysO family protein [Clostridium argentinense]MDU1348864.1 lysine exporter LysO family protein [Clostridium argentinense]